MIDLNNLTLGEIAFIEDSSGQPIAAIGDDSTPKGSALAALATVAKRRSGEPTFTLNAALALTLTEVNDLLGLDAEETEDEGKDDGSPETAPRSKRSSSSTSA